MRVSRILLAAFMALGTAVAEDGIVPEGPALLTLTGSLSAAEAERFAAPVTSSWQLQLKWLIDEGTAVEAGDPIARFDPAGVADQLAQTDERLTSTLQQRDLKEAEGRLQRLDVELALKRAEIEWRKAKLDAAVPEEALRGQEYRDRQLALGRTRKAYENAQLGLEAHDQSQAATLHGQAIEISQLRDKVARYEKELDEMEIEAGAPGIVVHQMHPWFGRKVREGDRVRATSPVASIPNLATLEVEAWAGEIDLVSLFVGQPVRMRLDAYPERWLGGAIKSIGRAGERRPQWGRSPYFRVVIGLDELDTEVMRPGMSVRCEVLEAQAIASAERP